MIGKVRKKYRNAKGKYISFNSDQVRKMCLYTCKEGKESVVKRSFQGIALDKFQEFYHYIWKR